MERRARRYVHACSACLRAQLLWLRLRAVYVICDMPTGKKCEHNTLSEARLQGQLALFHSAACALPPHGSTLSIPMQVAMMIILPPP